MSRCSKRPCVDSVEEIAKKRGVSMAQIAIAWVLSKPFVTAPIIGTSSLEKLKDSIGEYSFTFLLYLSWLPHYEPEGAFIQLTEEEIKALDEPYKPQNIVGHSWTGCGAHFSTFSAEPTYLQELTLYILLLVQFVIRTFRKASEYHHNAKSVSILCKVKLLATSIEERLTNWDTRLISNELHHKARVNLNIWQWYGDTQRLECWPCRVENASHRPVLLKGAKGQEQLKFNLESSHGCHKSKCMFDSSVVRTFWVRE